MRVRDHVVISTAGAALLSPWLGSKVLPAWAASILIDVDHYAWFAIRRRRIDLMDAVRYFNGSNPATHRATRVLHSPLVLLAILVVAFRRPKHVLPVFLGMALHAALDYGHDAQMSRARAAAVTRTESRCERCGTPAQPVGTHLWRQPPLLPSYDPRNLLVLCAACHRNEHARPAVEAMAEA